MSLYIASLNSGSNGNCYYIGNRNEAILIDGGISCREIEKRMKRLDLSLKRVRALFVSHEHGDHIHGIPTLVKKHSIPIYITPTTLQGSGLMLQQSLVHSFKPYEPVTIGGLSITAFPKQHDASDPHSFIISNGRATVGVFTDIGAACGHVKQHFNQCHAAFLESNYDEEMLANSGYSYTLKERVRGDQGHLSNKQALELFVKHRPAFMSHLFLSHLSENNNDPTLVQRLFNKVAGNTKIVIASRNKETQVYFIDRSRQEILARPVTALQHQLSLF